MKTRVTSLVMLLLLWSLTGWAQDYAFRVMANKGANKLNGEALMIGSKIDAGKIEVASGGYLGLAHVSGKTIELKEAGTFEVSKLVTSVNAKGNSSAASRYMNFVVDELTKKEDGDALARRYRHMSKTGSASRALGDANKKIRLLIPAPYKSSDRENKLKNNNYMGNYAAVSWYVNDQLDGFDPQAASGSYKVIVMDMGEQEVFSLMTKEPVALINLNDERLKDMPSFLYKVVDADDKSIASKNHVVIRMNERLTEQYQEEFAQLPQEDTAIASLIRAKFFEDKGLLNDAMAAYTHAVMLAPQVETYKKMRADFLSRAKITKEEDQARTAGNESMDSGE